MGRRRHRRHFTPTRSAQLIALAVLSVVVVGMSVVALTIDRTPPSAGMPLPPEPTQTPELIRSRAVYIGDSFTGGSAMGGVGEANWSVLASDKADWEPCVFAVGGSGWTRGGNEWTFPARIDWALKMNPSMVVFANGINDLDSGSKLVAPKADEALSYLRSIDPDVPVVVVGQVKVRDEQSPRIETVNAELRAVVEAHGALFIDPTAEGWFDGENRSQLGSDQFHPTDDGHVYFADRFVADLQSAGFAPAERYDTEYVHCSVPDWRAVYPDGTAAPDPEVITVGELDVPAVENRESRTDFTRLPDGPLTAADTGQPFLLYPRDGSGDPDATPRIVDGKMTFNHPGRAAGYASVPLEGLTTWIGGSFTFSPYTTGNGNATFAATEEEIGAGYIGNTSVKMTAHLSITPEAWSFTTFPGGGEPMITITNGTFSKPLAADSTTVHTASMAIDQVNGIAYLGLPDGTVRTVEHESIKGSAKWAFAEPYRLNTNSTDTLTSFTEFWADSRTPPSGP